MVLAGIQHRIWIPAKDMPGWRGIRYFTYGNSVFSKSLMYQGLNNIDHKVAGAIVAELVSQRFMVANLAVETFTAMVYPCDHVPLNVSPV